jgi:hypothetical protein
VSDPDGSGERPRGTVAFLDGVYRPSAALSVSFFRATGCTIQAGEYDVSLAAGDQILNVERSRPIELTLE